MLLGPSRSRPVADFTEVADRVWVARYEWFDVNVTVVGGDRGLLVVDTHGSAAAGARWSTTYAAWAPARWSAWSTPTGTSTTPSATRRSARRTARCPIHAHEDAADGAGPARRGDHGSATPTPPTTRTATRSWRPRSWSPTTTFSSARVLDLGDRAVELVHPGRGHTAGDLVVRVPDADVRARRRPGRGVGAAGVRLRTASRWSGRTASTPCSGCSRRGRSSSPATAPRSTASSSSSSATRSASSPRPSATSPAAASRSTRRWPPASGRGGGAAGAGGRRGYAQLPRGQRQLPLA